MFNPKKSGTENIVYSLAKSSGDKKRALVLVEKEYTKQGYIDAGKHLPEDDAYSRTVFVAKAGDKVVGTVCIINDSKAGLPMDDMYKKELDKLRFEGKKIFEVGRLATDRDFLKETGGLAILFSLFRLVFHYAIYQKIDYMCITVNPKHDLFYRSLSFKNIGPERPCPAVNNAPALPRALDIKKIRSQGSKNYLMKRVFLDSPPDYKIFE